MTYLLIVSQPSTILRGVRKANPLSEVLSRWNVSATNIHTLLTHHGGGSASVWWADCPMTKGLAVWIPVPTVHMSKCPRARHWTLNCSQWAWQCLPCMAAATHWPVGVWVTERLCVLCALKLMNSASEVSYFFADLCRVLECHRQRVWFYYSGAITYC